MISPSLILGNLIILPSLILQNLTTYKIYSTLDKLSAEVESTNKKLDEFHDSTSKAKTNLQRLGNEAEIQTKADVQALAKSIESAKQDFEKVRLQLDGLSKQIKSTISDVLEFISKA